MNTKPIIILAACICVVAGCNKSPTSSNSTASSSQSPPQVQAEPFHGQVYKSLDGRTVLTLVSKDECELNQDGTILLCKYTKPNDTLRVVVTALGTTEVMYFRFTDQGLQDSKGNVLLSPEGLAQIQAQIQAKQREEQLEKQREQEAENKARVETQVIATYAGVPMYDYGWPDQIILTDASLKFHNTQGNWVLYFVDISDIQAAHEYAVGGYGFEIQYDGNQKEATIHENMSQDANNIRDAVVTAYKAWSRKFPEVSSSKLSTDSTLYKEIQ